MDDSFRRRRYPIFRNIVYSRADIIIILSSPIYFFFVINEIRQFNSYDIFVFFLLLI